MKFLIIGDIHIGLNLAYTTPISRQRYRNLQLETVRGILSRTPKDTKVIFAGDLFHTYNVTDRSLIDGLQLISMLPETFVLAGNHDLSKTATTEGALQMLVEQFGCDQNVPTIVCKSTYSSDKYNSFQGLTLIPHQLTPEAFNKEVNDVLGDPAILPGGILVLHCNYGDWDGKSYENYLSSKQLMELKLKFSLVLSGHEHNSCNKDGLLYVGSILPCSFGEMSDKYVWEYAGVGQAEPIKTFDKNSQYKQVLVEEFLDDNFEKSMLSSWLFLEVVGQGSPSQNVEVSKKCLKLLNSNQTLIGIKPRVDVVTVSGETSEERTYQPLSWRDVVAGELQKDEVDIFDNYLDFIGYGRHGNRK